MFPYQRHLFRPNPGCSVLRRPHCRKQCSFLFRAPKLNNTSLSFFDFRTTERELRTRWWVSFSHGFVTFSCKKSNKGKSAKQQERRGGERGNAFVRARIVNSEEDRVHKDRNGVKAQTKYTVPIKTGLTKLRGLDCTSKMRTLRAHPLHPGIVFLLGRLYCDKCGGGLLYREPDSRTMTSRPSINPFLSVLERAIIFTCSG